MAQISYQLHKTNSSLRQFRPVLIKSFTTGISLALIIYKSPAGPCLQASQPAGAKQHKLISVHCKQWIIKP